MKSKIFSFILGFLIGAGIIYAYGYFTTTKTNSTDSSVSPTQQSRNINPGSFGSGDFNQRRNEKMAESMGMTIDKLQKELDSGKSIEQLMEEKGIEMPMRGRGFATGANNKGFAGRMGTGLQTGTGEKLNNDGNFTGDN